MKKDYKETLDWMVNSLPMYQKLGKTAFHPGLENINKLDSHLKHPHKEFASVHIAGTNGKGSTSHMLASILQEAGYKVGLYTSPHLKDYRERIRINGTPISEDAVVSFIQKNREFLEESHYSFFEMSVGLAFQYFAENKVDIAIIETGLGGRLDSTNILNPLLSIITNIGMDHLGMLGDSIEVIAAEKAGIIKMNTPVVIGEFTEKTKAIFKEVAKKNDAPIHWVNQSKTLSYTLDLIGAYQKYNALTVLEAIDILKKQDYKISKKAITNGLLRVVANTGLMGRWQVLKHEPLTVCDTAHNSHALKRVVYQIKQQKYNRLHFVIGMVSDKEVDKALEQLPQEATYYFCAPAIIRALDVATLQAMALKHKLKGDIYSNVKKAYEAAIENSTHEDMIFIGGSNFVVAEVL